MNAFQRADILIPKTDLETWAVVACDQYTSEPEYWSRVEQRVGDQPSAYRLILPEAQLKAPDVGVRIEAIHAQMDRYLQQGLFEAFPQSYVYVEREIGSGAVRRGIIGCVDLEQYDYRPGSESEIRATEGTVLERIPPRMQVRQGARLELPHVLLLCDDEEDAILKPLQEQKEKYRCLYDFDLMERGGHIRGWLLPPEEADALDGRLKAYCDAAPDRYQDLSGSPFAYAVGDGNHSLATAKACYEALKAAHPDEDLRAHPARWALVELENLHDPALEFEPIHRVVTGTQPDQMLDALEKKCGAAEGFAVTCITAGGERTICLNPKLGELAVGILQEFLDDYLKDHPGSVDYIHGDDVTRRLASVPEAIGFLLPPMEKRQLFRGVIAGGVLPRKTFSMGSANEKRFYLEGREIL